MSSISQIINFAGSYIVVCISAAFLIATIAGIYDILGSLLSLLISELYYILRNLGTLSQFFLYEFWEAWLFRELVDGNIRLVAQYVSIKTLRLFHPLIEVEFQEAWIDHKREVWVIDSDYDWENDSDDESEDLTDDDW